MPPEKNTGLLKMRDKNEGVIKKAQKTPFSGYLKPYFLFYTSFRLGLI